MANPSKLCVPSKWTVLIFGAIACLGTFVEGFQTSIKISHEQHTCSATAVDRRDYRHRIAVALHAKTFGSHPIETKVDDTKRTSGFSSRRSVLASSAATAAACVFGLPDPSHAGRPNGLILTTAPKSGLRWADAKVGTGELPSLGSTTSIDYSMASTAGRFPSIYSTKNGDEPYRWKIGDGSTIRGIEMAILGDPSEGIPPMRPGGIRRVIVPNALGYNSLIGRDDANNITLNNGSDQNLSPAAKNKRCLAGSEGSLGPIPPKEAPDGAYQRWYQFYCNPRIPYQPDLVLDIKLYGKRGSTATTASAAIVSPSSE